MIYYMDLLIVHDVKESKNDFLNNIINDGNAILSFSDK